MQYIEPINTVTIARPITQDVRHAMAKYIVAASAFVLYLGSLALPAFDLAQGDDSYYLGVVMVLFGAFSFDPRWLANPLWLIGVVCLLTHFRLTAVLTLAAASLLAVSCFTFTGTLIAQNSSGTETTILQMGPGYYIWLSSMVVPTVYAFYVFFVRRSTHPATD